MSSALPTVCKHITVSPVIFGADGLVLLLGLVPALLYDLDELFGVVEQQLLVRGLAAGHHLAPALGPENQGPEQCCGSGIRCLLDLRIRDPGWVKNPDPG